MGAILSVKDDLILCGVSPPAGGHIEAVPRHTEIPNKLARKICRSLSVPVIR